MGANKSLVFVSAPDSDARRNLDNAWYSDIMYYSCIRTFHIWEPLLSEKDKKCV